MHHSKNVFLTSAVLICTHITGTAQTSATDTSSSVMKGYLNEITIKGEKQEATSFSETAGTNIYAGKKNTLINVSQIKGNVVMNNMRQILAKVPGIQIWESDASGIQVGVSSRGLSPNRSWEYNVRQNGYDISADPYGYPEAYYNPQMQAVQQIQIVRGAGALQYGPQFGGLLNYILKDGSDIDKKVQAEVQQTAGSNALFNTYTAVGGSTAKLHYYAFFDHKRGNGWRENSAFYTNTGFATLNYKIRNRLQLGAEVMVYDMQSQQPGGLTDSMFSIDAKKSYRSRNYFSTPWTTVALNLKWQINDNSLVNVKLSGMWGDRNSVGFTPAINIKDTINTSTNEYNNRELAADMYRNYALEARYMTKYKLGNNRQNALSAGVKIYNGNTSRLQKGKGTTGSNYDMTLMAQEYPNKLNLQTQNAALFVENMFRLGKHLSITPGIRYEYITMNVNGRLGFDNNGNENRIKEGDKTRSILLAGAGAQYNYGTGNIYANITQAYRPMLFSDLTAAPTTDVIDPDLKDASGYNADLGMRGGYSNFLSYDVSVYYLHYNNRIGTISQLDQNNKQYNYRTNIGHSSSKGVEAYAELNLARSVLKCLGKNNWDLSIFCSYGFTDAVYNDVKVVSYSNGTLVTSNLKDKKVENAPQHIVRSGITAGYKMVNITYQYSYVDKAYSDATNTIKASTNGNTGLIPSYVVSDITAACKFNDRVALKAGINNLLDARYFTRRAGGYPGPGLLPADGRTAFISLDLKF